MIRALRRGHLRAALFLAVVLPLILALALSARPNPPPGDIPPAILSAPVATTLPAGSP